MGSSTISPGSKPAVLRPLPAHGGPCSSCTLSAPVNCRVKVAALPRSYKRSIAAAARGGAVMYLMYYLNAEGNRVYTLKVGEDALRGRLAGGRVPGWPDAWHAQCSCLCFSAPDSQPPLSLARPPTLARCPPPRRRPPRTARPPSRRTPPASRPTTSSPGSAPPASGGSTCFPRSRRPWNTDGAGSWGQQRPERASE